MVFQHSPLHDHESLWWVTAYFTFRRRLVSDRRRATQVHKQDSAASDIFSDRIVFFTSTDALKNTLSCLHPSIHALGMMLEKMRKALISGYHEASFYPGSWGHALKAAEDVISDFDIDKKLSNKASFLDGFVFQPLIRSDEETDKVDIEKEKAATKRKRQRSQDTPACPGFKGIRRPAKRVRLESETPLNAASMQTRSQTSVGRSERRR